jgi:hypothetical protein
MYHEGNRELQDRFGSRALADRLEEKLRRDRFTDEDAAFIAAQRFFFLATAAPDLLVWPDYDGNGMFKSLGNLRVNPQAGLLFIALEDRPQRLRVNGTVTLSFDDELLADLPGAQVLVKLTPTDIFPNCPRYLPKMQVLEPSVYIPQADAPPVEPKWKSFEMFADVVPPRARG